MKRSAIWIVLAGSLGLTACAKSSEPWIGGAPHGRYLGVGLYGPSRQWTRLAANQQAKDSDTARPIDDQIIIVVEDSRTGEVRACGDLSGYCIGMNPWKTALVSSQVAPIKLTEHIKPDPQDPDAAAPPTAKPSPK